MPLTREEIEQDLAAHRAQREQYIGQANAMNGVLAYLEHKLADLDAAVTATDDSQSRE